MCVLTVGEVFDQRDDGPGACSETLVPINGAATLHHRRLDRLMFNGHRERVGLSDSMEVRVGTELAFCRDGGWIPHVIREDGQLKLRERTP